MLSEQLFEKCEEFFDLISSEYRTCEVEAIIEEETRGGDSTSGLDEPD